MNNNNNRGDSSDEGEYQLPKKCLDFETWSCELSDELLELWEIIQNYGNNRGLCFLDECNSTDFMYFLYKNSNKYLTLFNKYKK